MSEQDSVESICAIGDFTCQIEYDEYIYDRKTLFCDIALALLILVKRWAQVNTLPP